ncbi:hypothetical protein M3B03_04690 [Corynebacterium pseudodiphtheriticum]|uniref:hypothetical protein n=1 Tax=Corynebacterium pseudodiphtheriticum TaxID=37637 RepID=UPI00223B4B29|nr:hypothetical protein [Corynebacterium pseudodiphtheriticum]MCT1634999.1 hypothetical protein [Corynebacterium pseudodiphtheriticum]MCT1666092.1 hypothetical protein [Corynebacterium pseudodiphtheriticum]
MANPAEILFNQFNEWRKDQSANSLRKDTESLQHHRIMVGHLNDVEKLLTVMEKDGKRVQSFRKYFPVWSQFLFAYPDGWGISSSSLISVTDLDALDMLIDPIDGYCLHADEEKFDDLRAYLDRVKQALDDDETLPSTVKLSTRTLVENLVTVIDSYATYGDVRLDDALQRLLGNLAMVAMQSKKTDVWRKILDRFVFPWLANQLPGLPMAEVLKSLVG